MAITEMGVFGDISGKIGQVQGSRTKSGNVLQSRVLSNGKSQTTKAIDGRTKFGSVRSLLAVLRDSFIDYACPVFDKKIGHWASWVKSVYPLAVASYDPISSTLYFANGTLGIVPILNYEERIDIDGYTTLVFLHGTLERPVDYSLRSVIYNVNTGRLVGEISMAPSYLNNIQIVVPTNEIEGANLVVFTMYTKFEPVVPFSIGLGYGFNPS